MITEKICKQKYLEFKSNLNRNPKMDEYLEYSGISSNSLINVFGENAYSKLQAACGDKPTKLRMIRTPKKNIMRQYGNLALKYGKLPTQPLWQQDKLKPGISGLAKPPHNIKWKEFPLSFKAWVEQEKVDGYGEVLEMINQSLGNKSIATKKDREFEGLINLIRNWTPAMRRSSEGEYKVELRKYLEAQKYKLNEETGDSKLDLLVNKKYGIEIKKAPGQADYDRLFGQLARHLQQKIEVIALIMDTPSQDKLNNFNKLVDNYLINDRDFIEVIKK